MMDAPVPGIPPGTKSCATLRSGISLSAVPNAERLVLAVNAFILDRFWNELRVIRRKSTKRPEPITTAFYAQPGAMRSAFAQFLSIPRM